jgi:sugar O-acyltransferase (sialic acid O-acetyltransferase NeuD family)
MKDIVIIGAGNFGREVAQLIEDINLDSNIWTLLGFIDETAEKHGTLINNIPVLGSFDWLEKNKAGHIYSVCAIGNPKDKYYLIKKASASGVDFCNLIHPEAKISKFVQLGTGCIICWNSFISVNTKIGNHVSINPGCGIGHDTVIGDYSSLYWNVTLSGNVQINEGCEIGSNAAVIPKRVIGKWSIIGAGAAVVRDIPENCTAVGVPARPITFG